MNLKHYVYLLFTILLSATASADQCGGKIDIGPVYVHLDVLQNGKTIKRLDMGGFKVNGTIMLKEGYGFCLKPDLIYAAGEGELFAGALGFGHLFPVHPNLCITPSVGFNVSSMRTSYDFYHPQLQRIIPVRERFHSTAPYVAIDANYTVWKGLRVCGSFQYSWSRTHTWLKKIGTFKSSSKGASYAAMIEQDFNDKWSLHLGAAYNVSLSHEKHGLRGYGFKLGIAHWY